MRKHLQAQTGVGYMLRTSAGATYSGSAIFEFGLFSRSVPKFYFPQFLVHKSDDTCGKSKS